MSEFRVSDTILTLKHPIEDLFTRTGWDREVPVNRRLSASHVNVGSTSPGYWGYGLVQMIKFADDLGLKITGNEGSLLRKAYRKYNMWDGLHSIYMNDHRFYYYNPQTRAYVIALHPYRNAERSSKGGWSGAIEDFSEGSLVSYIAPEEYEGEYNLHAANIYFTLKQWGSELDRIKERVESRLALT